MAKAQLVWPLLLLLGGCATEPEPPPPGSLRVATFSSDVTPPLGHPLCGGWIKPATEIVQPLSLKGILLDDGRTRYVVASMDWCVLSGTAYDLFRKKLAAGAGVPESQVALHTTHTHSAPIANARAEELIAATGKPLPHLDLRWLAEITDRAGETVQTAIYHLQPFTHVGVGQARVDHFASSRRVPGPDGKIKVRYSSTKDPFLQEAPEGRIDPWLKTVTLFDGDLPLVRMHYYASHPQSHYGDGRVHPDTPGMARTYLENEEGVPQIYFDGCGGDITAGKYNDGSAEAQLRMSRQLYSGMIRAIDATRRVPVDRISWKTVEVRFARRTEPTFSEEHFRKLMSDPSATAAARLTAALAVAWYERLKQRPGVELSRLRLGPADLLHLPGEPFVEYQLYAQSLRSDRFVAVAGYGEGGTGYICTDAAIAEGGYEPTESLVGPPSESLLKAAVKELLQ